MAMAATITACHLTWITAELTPIVDANHSASEVVYARYDGESGFKTEGSEGSVRGMETWVAHDVETPSQTPQSSTRPEAQHKPDESSLEEQHAPAMSHDQSLEQAWKQAEHPTRNINDDAQAIAVPTSIDDARGTACTRLVDDGGGPRATHFVRSENTTGATGATTVQQSRACIWNLAATTKAITRRA